MSWAACYRLILCAIVAICVHGQEVLDVPGAADDAPTAVRALLDEAVVVCAKPGRHYYAWDAGDLASLARIDRGLCAQQYMLKKPENVASVDPSRLARAHFPGRVASSGELIDKTLKAPVIFQHASNGRLSYLANFYAWVDDQGRTCHSSLGFALVDEERGRMSYFPFRHGERATAIDMGTGDSRTFWVMHGPEGSGSFMHLEKLSLRGEAGNGAWKSERIFEEAGSTSFRYDPARRSLLFGFRMWEAGREHGMVVFRWFHLDDATMTPVVE